jgi:hypothetical protein
MPSKSNCVKLSGYWIGTGIEYGIDVNGNIQKTELKLFKQIQKISDDVYKVDETYYNMNGTINYGPITYLISTGDDKKDFITSDSRGMGLDFYNVVDNTMIYRYNINGITIGVDEPYSSLNGTYKLKKVPQCF